MKKFSHHKKIGILSLAILSLTLAGLFLIDNLSFSGLKSAVFEKNSNRLHDIYFSNYFPTEHITVTNSTGNILPKRFEDIPCFDAQFREIGCLLPGARKNYIKGHASVIPKGIKYGGTDGKVDVTGSNAVLILPPGYDNDSTTVTLSNMDGSVDSRGVYNLHFKLGLRSDAPVGTKVVIKSIKISGTTSDKNYPVGTSPLPSSEVIAGPWTIETGKTYTFWKPLGLYTRFENFQVTIEVSKFWQSPNNWNNSLVFDELSLWRSPDLQLSVAQSNLQWNPAPIQDQIIAGSQEIGASYVRTTSNATTTQEIDSIIDGQKKISDNGQKLLIVIGQMASDTVPFGSGKQPEPNANAGEIFNQKCGWPQGSIAFSKIDQQSFAARLTTYLDAAVKAGVKIDAFEIGNEINWSCFNGDIPLESVQPADSGKIVDGKIVDGALRYYIMNAYAKFLDTAVHTIRKYYPNAIIVSPGIVMSGVDKDNAENQPGYMSNPGQLIGILREIKDSDGKDYFSYFKRIGIHIYPGVNLVDGTFEAPGPILKRFFEQLGAPGSTRYWVTEGGYNNWASSCFRNPLSNSCQSIKPGASLNLLSQQRYESWVKYIHSLMTAGGGVVDNMIFYNLYDKKCDDTKGWSMMDAEIKKDVSNPAKCETKSVKLQPETLEFFHNYQASSY